jgi:hypothetical protein
MAPVRVRNGREHGVAGQQHGVNEAPDSENVAASAFRYRVTFSRRLVHHCCGRPSRPDGGARHASMALAIALAAAGHGSRSRRRPLQGPRRRPLRRRPAVPSRAEGRSWTWTSTYGNSPKYGCCCWASVPRGPDRTFRLSTNVRYLSGPADRTGLKPGRWSSEDFRDLVYRMRLVNPELSVRRVRPPSWVQPQPRNRN